MAVQNAFQVVAKASASASKGASKGASTTKASASASKGAISPLIGQIIKWVDELPSSVTFYRSAVSHHKGKGTLFPRKPLPGDKELSQAWDETKKRISEGRNANGFTTSKAIFDAYIVGKYGAGPIR
jgi:hypothetical protein